MHGQAISVIIPSFNSEKTIQRAIGTVISQTFSDFEIIIVDGASADNTVNIIKTFAEKDKRIKYISEKDKGIYDAMNKGIDLAKAEWLYFLGSDDELIDDTVFEDAMKNADADNTNVLYGDVLITGDTSWAKDGQRYDGIFDIKKLFKRNICHQSIFYNSNFIKDKVGYYNTEYRLCADWDFNLKCRSKTEFLYFPRIVARFKGGGESTNNYTDENFSRDFLKNLLSYFNINVFDRLVNDTSFPYYHEVLSIQKKENFLKYFARRVKRKLNSLVH